MFQTLFHFIDVIIIGNDVHACNYQLDSRGGLPDRQFALFGSRGSCAGILAVQRFGSSQTREQQIDLREVCVSTIVSYRFVFSEINRSC